MSKKEYDQIAALEKAIAKKYGSEAVSNPKDNWDDEKEEQYIEQLKKIAERLEKISSDLEKVEFNGFFVTKKLLNREKGGRTCRSCETYSFDKRDDLYMNRFDCCFTCYMKHIEGRNNDK
tara:strand:+ start:510 stop:869 length:360 start_codon:yes stop_codon:yes gene_type:complete